MSSSDDKLASRIARHLDRGLTDMDPHTLGRLRAARETALERGAAQPGWRFANSGPGHAGSAFRHVNPRYLLPAAVLVLALSGMMFYQQMQRTEDPVDIDANLLAGVLPIDAYLDKGLDAWLKR